MNLDDSPDEHHFRTAVRRWLSTNGADAPRIPGEPSQEDIEAWRAWSRRLHEAGYVGLAWPAPYGHPLGPSAQAIWLEESGRAGVIDHLGIIGLGMAGPTILHWGSKAQKERLLGPLVHCEEIWCQGFSEPESGSDLASVRARAVRDGNEWVVNGQKVWSSFAHLADWCILLVRSDPDAPQHLGLSYLLLDMHSDGVEVKPLDQMTGDPEFNEIFLSDVRVPIDSMLGAPGDGWKVAMTTLSHERGTYGVGLAARLDSELRSARRVLSEPASDGSRPIDDAIVRDELATLWIELQALRITNLRALSTLARTGVPGPESSVAKLHWSELNQRLMRLVSEAIGPAALLVGKSGLDEGRWAYARLRSRGNTIEAGTSEILRNIIAERVVGLPRSR